MRIVVRFLSVMAILLASVLPLRGDSGEALARIQDMGMQEIYDRASDLVLKGNTDSAAYFYIVLAGKYSAGLSQEEKLLCLKACNNIGNIYYLKESYFSAFEFYFKSLNICEKNGFTDLEPVCYNNMGNFYAVFNDYEMAGKYYRQGLESTEKGVDTEMRIKILINLTAVSCYMNDSESARKYYDEFVGYSGKESMIGYFSLFHKALILSCEHKYIESVSVLRQALAFSDSLSLEPRYISSIYGQIARSYEAAGMLDSAIYWRRINEDYTAINDLSYFSTSNFRSLSELYESKGDAEMMRHYQKLYWMASDSVFNRSRFNEAKNSQFIYELDKIYQEVSFLTSEREQSRLRAEAQEKMLAVSATAIVVFLILLVVVWRQKRQLSASYEALYHRVQDQISQEGLLRKRYEDLSQQKSEEAGLSSVPGPLPGSDAGSGSDSDSAPASSPDSGGEQTVCASDTAQGGRLSEDQKTVIMEAVIGYMDEPANFCDPEFSLDKIAKAIGSNSKYVSSVVNECFGKNFRTFTNEYRVKEAIRRFSAEEYANYTMTAIGESVGFRSYTNFIDAFRRFTGITPSAYYKLSKQGKRPEPASDSRI